MLVGTRREVAISQWVRYPKFFNHKEVDRITELWHTKRRRHSALSSDLNIPEGWSLKNRFLEKPTTAKKKGIHSNHCPDSGICRCDYQLSFYISPSCTITLISESQGRSGDSASLRLLIGKTGRDKVGENEWLFTSPWSRRLHGLCMSLYIATNSITKCGALVAL